MYLVSCHVSCEVVALAEVLAADVTLQPVPLAAFFETKTSFRGRFIKKSLFRNLQSPT
jgi:hypothetical protein